MRPARGASVPTHPDAVSSAGIGAEAAVPCGRVAVRCVLHPAHVVGCLPPLPPPFFAAGEEGGLRGGFSSVISSRGVEGVRGSLLC